MKQVNLGFYRMVLFLLLGLFTSVIAYSQQISVKGIVKDQIGEPVIGATVMVKGSTNGTITDFDGNFILNDVSSNASLIVSYVGYVTETISVNGKSSFKIVMKEDAKTLEEVVVIGYGVVKKRDLTGSSVSDGSTSPDTLNEIFCPSV